MSCFSVISTKGQVTIPQEVRLRLGVKQGDRVEFVNEGGRTVIRPARKSASKFRNYVGFLPPYPGGSEAWIREMRDADDEPK